MINKAGSFYVLFGLGLASFALMTAEVAAAPISVVGGGEFHVPVQSFTDQRFKDVSRQKFDFSCGSAAVATILSKFYNYNIDEKEALTAMYEVGDKEKIKKEGFSLLDMKNYLSTIGFTADGYKDSLDKLKKVKIPAIALINTHGYHHFVVISGVNDDSVIVLDSARGKRIMRRNDFESEWNNVLFIIRNDMAVAKKTFNKKGSWAAHQQARFNAPIDAGDLASAALQNAFMPGYF